MDLRPETDSVSDTGKSHLVRRAQDGDQTAFERLYREHVNRVYALCLRLSADADRAEELTQDVFVRTWENIASYRGDSAFSTWLHRLTVNVVLADWRSEARRVSRVRATDLSRLEDGAGSGTPEVCIDLERAIAALPPALRTVFILHDIEGYPHEEIAKLTGQSPVAVRVQLHRARKRLREALDR
jgi:RNA polymerase sigma-70 factor (ECF subfamily)